MILIRLDGFPIIPRPSPIEKILGKTMPSLDTILSFNIQASGWDTIILKETTVKHIFHFCACKPQLGNVEAVIDVKDREDPKVLVIERQGLSDEIDFILGEAVRVATSGYHASLVRPYITKLVITRYGFNTGVCVQHYVDVYKSRKGNYVVPGYFHGVKPVSLGQFFNHNETAEMISLPQYLEQDRRHFDRCMFRLIRRKTRDVIHLQNQKALLKTIENPKAA